MSNNDANVPFNDLTRIHVPLIPDFNASLDRLVRNSNLVLGTEVQKFESKLAVAEGAFYAIGVNNGTNAIELALRALEIKPGDEVLVPAFTFVATAFAVLSAGGIPVLVDVDPLTGLIDLTSAESAITPKTKALVLVTIHGRVDNLDRYKDFCESFHLKFIVDGAQSHLGTFGGVPLIKYCDISTLSFYPGKNLGALGEGGAILTNNEEVARKLRLMRDWGAEKKYEHSTWGGNFRLESLQASFLSTKLEHLELWTTERKNIAAIYQKTINPEHQMETVSKKGSHVFHIFALNVINRNQATKILDDKGISFGFHYPTAIHQNLAFRSRVKIRVKLSQSEKLSKETLSLPIFPKMTQEEIGRVLDAVACFSKK